MRTLLALSLVLLGACASGTNTTDATTNTSDREASSGANSVEPTIEIVQTSGVPPAARHVRGGISVQYALRVGNPGAEAITLKRVSVQTVTDGAYIVRHSLPFDVAIAASEREIVRFWAPAQTGNSVVGANGPVTLRVTCEFDGPGGRFQEVVTRVVNASASVSGD